ncbi:receptor-type tyrosine-protein phosphatase eta isoform X2 [Lingula anatina]|uniref:protein-tyrosine-phosphatase n=1 Tax=Lingula anatina TaxID=7574 RepID=A0A1S3HQ93_LINAN|nr:receptor-type tyrosine-protein phosphatase eta isoform X2 [Lingula anatina]|eukprot:XP_013387209.1 receptor-type tyrosine-protein phosphatase eta isoform X2 [Lingula anatina]
MEKIRYFALIFIVTRVALPVTCQTTNESIDSTTASTLTTTSQVTTESTSVTTIAVTTTEAAPPPSAPRELTIASKTTKSLEVTWQIANETIDSYIVQFKLKDAPVTTFNVSHRLSNSTNSANITGLSPGQYYTVQVIATRGQLNSSDEIIRATVPASPSLSVSTISTSAVNFSWTINGERDSFNVSCLLYTEKETRPNISDVTTGEWFSCSPLTPGAEYLIKVTAVLEEYSGTPATQNIVTLPSPVSNISFPLEYLSENSMQVSWTAGAGYNDGYLVTVNDTAAVVKSSAISDTHRNITELTAAKGYNVTIVAKNRNGNVSRAMSRIQYTRQERPSKEKIEIKVASQRIWATFDHLEHDLAFDQLEGTLHLKINGTIVKNAIGKPTEHHTTVLFDGLTVGESYIVEFRYSFHGVLSKPMTEEIDLDPSVPHTLKNLSVTEKSFTLTWSAGDGVVGGYYVEVIIYRTQNTSFSKFTNETSANVTSLQPGTRYSVSVTAASRGLMENSTALTGTFQTYPAKPTAVQVIGLYTDRIQLEWKKGKGEADSYIVSHSVNNERVDSSNLADPVYNITGLTPGATYEINITAYQNHYPSEPLTIINQTKPGTPGSIIVSDRTPRALGIQWSNSSGVVDEYVVDVGSTGAISQVYTVNGKSTVNITGLDPGQMYHVSVKAVTGELFGDVSKENVSTEEIPPSAPINLTSDEKTTNSTNLKWEEPQHPNGKVTDYFIEYWQADHKTKEYDTYYNISTNSADTSYSVINLIPGSTYKFQVKAVNSKGPGEVSNNITVTTNESTPGEVSNLTVSQNTSMSMNIGWEEPIEPNGEVITYEMHVLLEDKSCVQQVTFSCTDCPAISKISEKSEEAPSCTSTDTTQSFSIHGRVDYTVRNLVPYTNYTFRVYPFTSVGRGKSKDMREQTLEDTPSEPRNVMAVNITQNEKTGLNITWEAPDNPRGIITGYQLRVTVNDTSNFHNTTDEFKALPDLLSYQNHTIEVRAYTVAGPGNWSKPLTVLTGEARPSAPQHIAFGDISPTSIEVQWQDPVMKRGILIGYLIIVTKASNGEVVKNETQDANEAKSFDATGLDPCQHYTFKVAARTSKGFGNYSSEQTNSTAVNIPGTPVIVKAEAITSTSILVMWIPPPNETCPIDYVVEVTDNDSKEIVKEIPIKGYNSTEKEITNLKKFWSYDIKVKANTTAGPSMPSTNVKNTTLEDTPGPPARVNASCDVCYNSMTVTWEAPTRENKNGIITGYVIYYTDGEISKNKKIDIGSQKSSTITSLSAEKSYQVKVAARTRVGEGEKETAPTYVNLTSGPPIFVAPANTFAKVSTASVEDARKQISLQVPSSPFGSENGIVRNISVIVAEDSEAGKPESDVRKDNKFPTLKTWGQVKDLEKITPYAIKEVEPNPWGTAGQRQRRAATPYEIIIGSQDCSNVATSKYCNGPLPSGRTYCIRIRGYTTNGYTDTPCVKQGTEPDTTGAIAGGVTAVLIVLIIAFVVLFIIAKRRGVDRFTRIDSDDKEGPTVLMMQDLNPSSRLIGGKSQRETTQRNPSTAGHDNEGFDGEELKSRSSESDEEEEAWKSRPVSTSQFKEHVEKYHRDSDLLFSDEYKTVKELAPSYEWLEAEKPSNRCKNRYTNILPFDHSRVKLLPIDDDEGSDYINANYMPGYRSKREFIAAQGPLPATKDDFWRMIWEQNVTLVVMVTQCVERGRIKCEQYWPKDTEAEYYGDLVVQMRSESTLSDYTIRILDVQLGNNTRTVRHFNFTVWPDFGCPDTTRSLLEFVKVVRTHIKPDIQGPICVHCSAGVGRTGTFIAVDRLLQHIREHNEVDIFGLVLEMRENRCNMVQTEDQYIYIHECIKDAIAQGMHLNNGNLEDQL